MGDAVGADGSEWPTDRGHCGHRKGASTKPASTGLVLLVPRAGAISAWRIRASHPEPPKGRNLSFPLATDPGGQPRAARTAGRGTPGSRAVHGEQSAFHSRPLG